MTKKKDILFDKLRVCKLSFGCRQGKGVTVESSISTDCVLARVLESGGYSVDAELDVVG